MGELSNGYNIVRLSQDIPAYLMECKFLPVLNDELPYKNSTFKERFSRLNRLVLIMFEQDNVLVPRETSWFGYYSDGSFCEVLSRNQTTFYIEDWIGPRALDEAGYLLTLGNSKRAPSWLLVCHFLLASSTSA